MSWLAGNCFGWGICNLLCDCWSDGNYESLADPDHGDSEDQHEVEVLGAPYFQQQSVVNSADDHACHANSSCNNSTSSNNRAGTTSGKHAVAGIQQSKRTTAPVAIPAAPAIPALFAKYELKGITGQGVTSKCFRTVRKSDGAIFACKVIDKRQASSKFTVGLVAQFLSEAHVLRLLQSKPQHPNVVRLQDDYETSDRVYLVMEMAAEKNLLEYVADKGSLNEAEAANLVRQITSGLSYLHSAQVIHRDLKPENILVWDGVGSDPATRKVKPNINKTHKQAPAKSNMQEEIKCTASTIKKMEQGAKPVCKIIDFGLSKVVGTAAVLKGDVRVVKGKRDVSIHSRDVPSVSTTLARTFVGTKGFIAPEMLQRLSYSHAVDIWALGVLAYVVLCGCLPFPDETSKITSSNDAKKRFELKLPSWAGTLSPAAKNFLSHL